MKPDASRTVYDGTLVDVTSEGDFVEAGTHVRVVRVEGNRIVVRASGAPRGASGTPA